MTDEVVALADYLMPADSVPVEVTNVALNDIVDSDVDLGDYPAPLMTALSDNGLRRPLLLVSLGSEQHPPYRALTERHLLPALRHAGCKTVPARVITPEAARAAVDRLAERFRETEDVLERAWLCDTLRSLADACSMSGAELADAVGVTRQTIYRYGAISDLRPTLLRLLVSGQLGLTHATACTTAPPSRQADVAGAVVRHRLSRKEAQSLARSVTQSPDAPLQDLTEAILIARPASRAAAFDQPRTRTSRRQTGARHGKARRDGANAVDLARYTSLLSDDRREALGKLAEQMRLDSLTVRRAALLLLAEPRLVVPSAVAYAQYVGGKELGQAVAQMELALARMRAAADEGMTPNERKVLELVLHHVPRWAEEVLTAVREAPAAVSLTDRTN